MAPWLGTAGRISLGGVLISAGIPKVIDYHQAVRAVAAYQILPIEAAQLVGGGLPFLEISIGLLLVLGITTRAVAAAAAGMLMVFMAAIASAWMRDLSIDCGCFGGGGATANPQYASELLRDAVLLGVAILLTCLRRTRFTMGWRDESDRKEPRT